MKGILLGKKLTVAPILKRMRANKRERLSQPSLDQTSTNPTQPERMLDSGIF